MRRRLSGVREYAGELLGRRGRESSKIEDPRAQLAQRGQQYGQLQGVAEIALQPCVNYENSHENREIIVDRAVLSVVLVNRPV